MSESKHTPGPWIKDGKVITNESYKQIALVAIHEKSIEERESNLALIAAAPEMLAALEELHYHFGNAVEAYAGCDMSERIESIIKKAKGQ